MGAFTERLKKFPWRDSAVFTLGIANLLAIATLFFIPPDPIEPGRTPWEWWGWIARAQFMPAVLALDFAVIAATIAATLLFGRIYCEAVCPLGVTQDILRKASFLKRLGVRRVCPRLPVSRPVWIVRLCVLAAVIILAAAGLGAFWLDPYAIFCRALALFPLEEQDTAFIVFAAVPFAAAAVLSFAGKGRIWCNAVCPAGTVFAILAKFKIGKTRFNRACGRCRECFPAHDAQPQGGKQ